MEIYTTETLENDDIFLEKYDIDLTKYNIIKQENGDIILKKIKKNIYLTNINEIKKYNYLKSNIINCYIDNIKYDVLKYNSIRSYIYHKIDDGSAIIKHSVTNIKTFTKVDEGFYYSEKLGISYQGCDSNKCVFEIISQCINNKIKLSLTIQLHDDSTIYIDV
jgi:hypothetical protein